MALQIIFLSWHLYASPPVIMIFLFPDFQINLFILLKWHLSHSSLCYNYLQICFITYENEICIFHILSFLWYLAQSLAYCRKTFHDHRKIKRQCRLYSIFKYRDILRSGLEGMCKCHLGPCNSFFRRIFSAIQMHKKVEIKRGPGEEWLEVVLETHFHLHSQDSSSQAVTVIGQVIIEGTSKNSLGRKPKLCVVRCYPVPLILQIRDGSQHIKVGQVRWRMFYILKISVIQ